MTIERVFLAPTPGGALVEIPHVRVLVGAGIELCEPCMGLGEALASAGVTPSAAVKFLVHRAGIRADVLSSGTIAVGAEISHAA